MQGFSLPSPLKGEGREGVTRFMIGIGNDLDWKFGISGFDFVESKQVRNERPNILQKLLQRRGFGNKPWDVAAFPPPHSGVGVPMGQDLEGLVLRNPWHFDFSVCRQITLIARFRDLTAARPSAS